jgi:hypothetical protein
VQLVLAAIWPALLLSQAAAPKPGTVPEAWWTGRIERPLRCEANKYPAILGFDFRYWTGIDFLLDLQQFTPLKPGRRLYLLFRVTPEGRPPRYFLQRQFMPDSIGQLPPGAKLKNLQMPVGGGVHLGAGKYKVDAVVADQDGRACRQNWNVVAKPIAEPLRQEPLTVETPPPPKSRVPGEARQRVAVVANADSFGPRRYSAKLSARDRSALMDSLQSLADTWDSADFSLHLLHLERRQVLLTEPRLESASFERIDEALRRLDNSTVDIGSLERGARGAFFAQFVERSAADWSRYDAVIFLGPAWRWFDRLPEALRKKQRDLPRMYHLALTPQRFPPDNLFKQFVAAQDGQVLPVHYPVDLARAIKKVRQVKP